jgi:hypothetical protein
MAPRCDIIPFDRSPEKFRVLVGHQSTQIETKAELNVRFAFHFVDFAREPYTALS